MKAAEYPMKKCRDGFTGSLGQGYNCELPTLHPGPCASFSSKESVTNRDRWEERNPGWEKRIGDLDTIV